MLTEREINRNTWAMEHAIAQQTLEGLTLPPAAVADLNQVVQGKISTTDALRNAHARFANAKIFHA